LKIFFFKTNAFVTVGVALIVWLPGQPSSHAAPRVKATFQAALLDIDGDFGVLPNSNIITLTSDANALGLKEETVFQPRLDFDWKDWHLWLIGFQADYSGSGTLEAKVQIGSFPPITRGTPVRTDAGFKYLAANVVYDVLLTDFIDIGLGLGGGLVNYELAFKSQLSSVRVAFDDTLPFVFPLVRIVKEIGNFGLAGTIGGIAIVLGAHDINYLQMDVGISYRVFDQDEKLQGNVILGYQYFEMDYVYEGQSSVGVIDVILSGPYLGFALSF
jgi:hypothetical protein